MCSRLDRHHARVDERDLPAAGFHAGSTLLPICLNRLVTALYRKYRPQTFDEVVGQEAGGADAAERDRGDQVRQAYLFAGPRGTGKTSMARILAKSAQLRAGADDEARQHLPRVRRDLQRHVARRRRDGRGVAARDRRHPRDPGPRRPAAGRGALQGLHPRRGAPAHRRSLERAAEDDRGAAASPRCSCSARRAREGDPDRALALPDVLVRAPALRGLVKVLRPRDRGRGFPGAGGGAVADRPRGEGQFPGRRVDCSTNSRPRRAGS